MDFFGWDRWDGGTVGLGRHGRSKKKLKTELCQPLDLLAPLEDFQTLEYFQLCLPANPD